MLGRPRFWLYRTIVACLTWLGFRTQKVVPIGLPVDGAIEHRPFAEAHPDLPVHGLHEAQSFPKGDAKRVRRIELTARLLALVTRIAPTRTPPVPDDEKRFLAVAYPWFFRRAWPMPPRVPPELSAADADVLAELAVRGPFGSYLRRGGVEDEYVVDLTWMTKHDARPEFVRPGGLATFAVRDGRLVTVAVDHDRASGAVARAAFLAGLNEDLTTFRHYISVHLAMLTSFALATSNNLDAAHPVRRLLHHCFHTVLIGNREVGSLQLSGPRGFAATIFSHDATQVAAMADEHLGRFDVWDFAPDVQFRNRGTTETPFAYPYRDNILGLWADTTRYVEEYLDRYYESDAAVSKDASLAAWAAELDRLLPNGVAVPIGGVDLAWLTRACATLIHVSTAEHDVLNNVVWNYSTLGWIIPTVVPRSGVAMDQRRAFDLIATLMVTWKPYNMLLTADIPSLALDDRAADVMRRYVGRLELRQADMASRPHDPSLAYPAGFNVSISN